MIQPIVNLLTKPGLVNLSQNTAARVTVETGMKAIGRPGFILLDNDIDDNTKKYSATKEFLYQAICLGVYLAVIPPVFKNGAFKLAKKAYKNTKGFEHFKNAKEFLDFHKLATVDKTERLKSLADGKFDKFKDNKILMDLIQSDKNMKDELALQKGVIETSSFLGSILGLAILAPEISHETIHPIMRALGMEKKPEDHVDIQA